MKKVSLGMLFLCLMVHTAFADIIVVRQVVISPKLGRVMTNIGPLNMSTHVRLDKAVVDISVGTLPSSEEEPVTITINAEFTLHNDSSEQLALTVGFPISNSRWSAFKFKSFNVTTDQEERSVFNRTTGYPGNFKHKYVSGPAKNRYLPNYDLADEGDNLFKIKKIVDLSFHNLMVWAETFAPEQTRIVKVNYVIEIPLQESSWRKKRVKGNHKGIWPQEANGVPVSFLNTIPSRYYLFYHHSYYFFDYYLVSGAAWKGPIGEEIVTLTMDRSWQGCTLYSNHLDKLKHKADPAAGAPGKSLTYTYILRDTEPTENIYFALKRP